MKLFANTLTDKDVIKHTFQEKKNKDKDRAHYIYMHARRKRTYYIIYIRAESDFKNNGRVFIKRLVTLMMVVMT